MKTKELAGGVAHEMPEDFAKVILSDTKMLALWEDITPLARNKWICWVTSAKKQETRERPFRFLFKTRYNVVIKAWGATWSKLSMKKKSKKESSKIV